MGPFTRIYPALARRLFNRIENIMVRVMDYRRQFGLFLAAIAVSIPRFAAVYQPVWHDEVITMRYLTEYGYWGLLIDLPLHQPHFPLYYLMIELWTQVTGLHPLTARQFSVVAGFFVVFVTVQIGREWADIETGALAGSLLVISPTLVIQSGWLRMYALLTLATALCWWAYARARMQDTWWRWVVVAGLTVHLHPYGLLLVATIVAVALYDSTPPAGPLLVLGVISAPLIGLLGLKLAGTYGLVDSVAMAGTASLIHLSSPPTLWHVAGLPGALLFGRLTTPTHLLFAVSVLVGIGAVMWRDRAHTGVRWATYWLVLPVLGVLGLSYTLQPIWQLKYLVIVAPPVALLLAIGLRQLPQPVRYGAVTLIVLTQAFILLRWGAMGDWLAIRVY